MQPYWTSSDGRYAIYHGNSLDLLDQVGRAGVSAIVTDPPYGINYEASRYETKKSETAFSGVIAGDANEFDPAHLLVSDVPKILWGGNNFAHRLPAGGWLCWDKRTSEEADRMFGAPFEMAWCSDRAKFKILRCQHGGVVNADGPGIKRQHPTQKPIRVMEWCIRDVLRLKADSLVLDPYCGSGTTGVACVRLGHRFIGIEIEEKFCEVAVSRIKQELSQPRLPGLSL